MTSVRTRLTLALVILTALIAAIAVTLGSRLVENQLVDRKLDAAELSVFDPQTGDLFFPLAPLDFDSEFDDDFLGVGGDLVPEGVPLDSQEFPPDLFSEFVSASEYNAVTGYDVSEEFFDIPVPRAFLYFDVPDITDTSFEIDDDAMAASFVAFYQPDLAALARSGTLEDVFEDIGEVATVATEELDRIDVIMSDTTTGVLERDGTITLADRPPGPLAITVDLIEALSFIVLGGVGRPAPAQEILRFGGESDEAVFAYRELIDVRLADISSGPNDQSISVMVGSDITGVAGDAAEVSRLLWIAAALLVLLAGVSTWVLTGRALRPVAAIREQVLAINSGTLSERVPVANQRDEIGRLATTMNGMLDRLESGLLQRRRFVSDAAHELRTPVAILQSEAEVALRAPDRTTTEELAASVLDESQRLGAIVEDLLTLARVDEGRVRPAGTPVDLDDLVLEQAQRPRQLPVDRTGVSAGRVLGRSDDLERMIGHLLDNAARHGRTRVWVSVATEGDVVCLTVDDDGAGIPASERDRVFERFVRLDDARSRDAGGSGLGLAVVAATVGEHGGSVAAEVSPEGGARIVVTLPLASGTPAARALLPV